MEQSCFGLFTRTIHFLPRHAKLAWMYCELNHVSIKDNPQFVWFCLGILGLVLLEVIGAKKEEIRVKVLTALEEVGLKNKIHNYPDQLSGGEQQRVYIARALAKNPKLLLCDEPTGALDYITGKSILKLLQDTCKEKNMTVIVITHNSALTPMADKIVKIKNGQVDKILINENPAPVEQIEW